MAIYFPQGDMPQKSYKSIALVYESSNGIHPVIRKNFGLDDTDGIIQEEMQARKMQQYFQEIFDKINGKASSTDWFTSDIINYLKESAKDKNVFNYAGLHNTNEIGTNFEKDIGQIIVIVFEKAKPKNSNNTVHIKLDDITIGAQQASPFILEQIIIDDLKDEFGEEITNRVIAEVQKKLKQQGTMIGYNFMSKDGKIDIAVPESTLRLEFAPNSGLEEFASLLRGATFSAKNYSFGTLHKSGYHIGNTDQYRVMTAGLNYYREGLSKQTRDRIYNATMNSNDALEHFQHIRFIYELAGIGLTYNKGEKNYGPAKFLITNARNTTSANAYIQVHSIRWIVLNEYLQLNSEGGVSINPLNLGYTKSGFK